MLSQQPGCNDWRDHACDVDVARLGEITLVDDVVRLREITLANNMGRLREIVLAKMMLQGL